MNATKPQDLLSTGMNDAPPTSARVLLDCLRVSGPTLYDRCLNPDIDWRQVVADAHQHLVSLWVLDALTSCGAISAGLIPIDAIEALRKQRRGGVALAVKLDAAMRTILAALQGADIPVVVLKGISLARLYPTVMSRPRSDIDLLIEPEHWDLADRILTDLGFELLDKSHVYRPLLSAVQAPEDRQYRRLRDATFVELHADFLSTGLRRREDEAVWQRVEHPIIGGFPVPVLSPGDAILQVTTHMQRHAYTRLLWFFDLYLLLQATASTVDWPALARQAEQAGVTTAVYYGISYTEALFGRITPPVARQALCPSALRRYLHETMWPRRRILALDISILASLDGLHQEGLLPPSVFDVYATPRTMLTHALLSGNVWPKLRCLARRFWPSEHWLRYYGPQSVNGYRQRIMLARVLNYLLRRWR